MEIEQRKREKGKNKQKTALGMLFGPLYLTRPKARAIFELSNYSEGNTGGRGTCFGEKMSLALDKKNGRGLWIARLAGNASQRLDVCFWCIEGKSKMELCIRVNEIQVKGEVKFGCEPQGASTD